MPHVHEFVSTSSIQWYYSKKKNLNSIKSQLLGLDKNIIISTFNSNLILNTPLGVGYYSHNKDVSIGRIITMKSK